MVSFESVNLGALGFRVSELQINLEELESTVGKSNRVVFVNAGSNALSLLWLEVEVIFLWLTTSIDEWMEMRQSLIDFPVKQSTWFDCSFTQQLLVGHSAVENRCTLYRMTMTEL